MGQVLQHTSRAHAMIQNTQSKLLNAADTSARSEILGALVTRYVKGVESREPRHDVVDGVLRAQAGLRAVCCRCGKEWTITPVGRSQARRLYNVAMTTALTDLVREVRRRLDACVLACPQCDVGIDPASVRSVAHVPNDQAAGVP